MPRYLVETETCPYGHPWVEDNIYITKQQGVRVCRTCSRERGRDQYRKKKGLPPLRTPEFKREARFWSKVIKLDNGCWEWQGALDRDGYAVFKWEKGHRAHRYSYERKYGPISEETLDHICHTSDCDYTGKDCPHRRCVNPDHLKPASVKANNYRNRKTHCSKGHLLAGENLRVRPNGERCCRICRVEATRRSRTRKRVRT